MKHLRSTCLCLAPFLALPTAAQVATPPSTASAKAAISADEAREIWDTGFRQKRPASRTASATTYYTAAKPAGARPPATSKAFEAAIGLTIWCLRPPHPNDRDGSRILVQDMGPSNSAVDLVPERISDSTPLHVDDRIRLSLEVPRAGFLYVIDREQYKDGTTGDPLLIFPTLNMNHGRNEVVPGRVVEIPPQDSTVRALRIARSSDRQSGEDLIVIVSATPLPELKATDGAQALPASQVASWDREWGINSVALDLEGGQHKMWSAAEQEAGRSPGSTLLTQADPLPQTILTTAPHSGSAPLLVHIALKFQ